MDYPKHEYPFSAVDLGPRKGNVERKRQKTKVKKRNTEILSRGLCSLVWKQQGLPCSFLRGEAIHSERRAKDDGWRDRHASWIPLSHHVMVMG